MKYIALYLKYLVVIILFLITICFLVLGVICLGLGTFGAVQDHNINLLVLIPVGLYCGFAGFVAFDAFQQLMDRWRSKYL